MIETLENSKTHFYNVINLILEDKKIIKLLYNLFMFESKTNVLLYTCENYCYLLNNNMLELIIKDYNVYYFIK